MAENSSIGWTDHTHNFWIGCDKVSSECDHCYIGPLMKRFGREPFNGPIRTRNWGNPLRWQTRAMREDRRFRVFTCSLSDFFHRGADPWRDDAWDVIKSCNRLDWLILTKRIRQASARLPDDWGAGYKHVWLGVTVGCSTSQNRLRRLFETSAALRWVSIEPILEPIDLTPFLSRLDWVVCGGESGAKRRPSKVEWYRHLFHQCRDAGVPFYMKQDTAFRAGQQGRIPDDLWAVKQYPRPVLQASRSACS